MRQSAQAAWSRSSGPTASALFSVACRQQHPGLPQALLPIHPKADRSNDGPHPALRRTAWRDHDDVQKTSVQVLTSYRSRWQSNALNPSALPVERGRCRIGAQAPSPAPLASDWCERNFADAEPGRQLRQSEIRRSVAQPSAPLQGGFGVCPQRPPKINFASQRSGSSRNSATSAVRLASPPRGTALRVRHVGD